MKAHDQNYMRVKFDCQIWICRRFISTFWWFDKFETDSFLRVKFDQIDQIKWTSKVIIGQLEFFIYKYINILYINLLKRGK